MGYRYCEWNYIVIQFLAGHEFLRHYQHTFVLHFLQFRFQTAVLESFFFSFFLLTVIVFEEDYDVQLSKQIEFFKFLFV